MNYRIDLDLETDVSLAYGAEPIGAGRSKNGVRDLSYSSEAEHLMKVKELAAGEEWQVLLSKDQLVSSREKGDFFVGFQARSKQVASSDQQYVASST